MRCMNLKTPRRPLTRCAGSSPCCTAPPAPTPPPPADESHHKLHKYATTYTPTHSMCQLFSLLHRSTSSCALSSVRTGPDRSANSTRSVDPALKRQLASLVRSSRWRSPGRWWLSTACLQAGGKRAGRGWGGAGRSGWGWQAAKQARQHTLSRRGGGGRQLPSRLCDSNCPTYRKGQLKHKESLINSWI